MEVFLTDIEIQDLINERKQMSIAPEELFRNMRDKRGHRASEHIIPRPDDSTFIIKVRINNENPLDFSVILGYSPANSTKLFLIRRYNGKSHEHKNKLEGEIAFYNYHIHTATERYQREGTKEEYYAEETDRYSTVQEALNCLIADCNITPPPNAQLQLEI
jgi:hypothetical protein